MAFLLSTKQSLRISRAVIRVTNAFQHARIVGVEHLLITTEEFLFHLRENGAEVMEMIAKPYSIDEDAERRLLNDGFNIVRKSYDELENSDYLARLLDRAVARSCVDGKKILVIDVGGYFAKFLVGLDAEASKCFAGCIEVTTFGHHRYRSVEKKMPVPVLSVARSPLKEIEGRFTGLDAVAAVDMVFRKLGVSLPGRDALVVGYGIIGENVARALNRFDLRVSVYDRDDTRLLHAFVDGYGIGPKQSLLRNADIVFAATGSEKGALTYEELKLCKHDAVLASVGSKDTEFDVSGLRLLALRESQTSEYLTKFDLDTSKSLYVVKSGTAVNFLMPSTPTEIIDLVFAEIAFAANKFLQFALRDTSSPIDDSDPPPAIGQLLESDHVTLRFLAKKWLNIVNHR
jgi:adenosylhomocysteinase